MACDALHPPATWSELEEALGNGREEKRDPLRIHYDLNNVPVHRRREFVDRFTELGADFDVTYGATKSCKATIKSILNDDAVVPNGTNSSQERSHAAV